LTKLDPGIFLALFGSLQLRKISQVEECPEECPEFQTASTLPEVPGALWRPKLSWQFVMQFMITPFPPVAPHLSKEDKSLESV